MSCELSCESTGMSEHESGHSLGRQNLPKPKKVREAAAHNILDEMQVDQTPSNFTMMSLVIGRRTLVGVPACDRLIPLVT